MTDERLTEHARTHLTGYGIESELCAEFLRMLDAEARASRAEQALTVLQQGSVAAVSPTPGPAVSASSSGKHSEQPGGATADKERGMSATEHASSTLSALTDGEVRGDCPATTSSAGVAAALSTERERVIQECAKVCDSVGAELEERYGAEIAAERIRALSSLPTPPLQTQTWIPCSEQLPELDEPVEIFMPKNRTQKRAIASRNHNGGTLDNYEWHWWYECGYTDVAKNRVTHWQPLPTPPEEAKA